MAYTTSSKSISQKLAIKPGLKFLLVNAPDGYIDRMELPVDTVLVKTTDGPVDAVQVFTRSRQELEAYLPGLKTAIKPSGMIWVTYYKGSSKNASDIHRDTINSFAMQHGLQGVAIVSIDQDWSALRLKIMPA